MIDNHFRTKLELALNPFMHILLRAKISPNQITVLSFVFALISAYFVSQADLYLAIGIWWFSRFLDGLDGIYARYSSMASLFGSYLDICLDMLSYSTMILAFYFYEPSYAPLYMMVLVMYVMSICSALSLGSLEAQIKSPARDNRGLRLGAGLAEGGETGFFYSLFCFFPDQLSILLKLWLTVLIISVTMRSVLAYRTLRGHS